MLKRLLRGRAVRWLLCRLIGLYLEVALRSSRWKIEVDPATWSLLTGRSGSTVIVVFWHEYLPLVPILWWRARRENPSLSLIALISRHRDGRMIADIMRRWDIQSVDGSSADRRRPDKGGTAALRRLLGLLGEHKVVCLTPDGPRGPRRVMRPGAAHLAAYSGVSVVPIAATCRPARRIGSWDRMMLPLPFSRGSIRCGTPITVSRQDKQDAAAIIGDALDALDEYAA